MPRPGHHYYITTISVSRAVLLMFFTIVQYQVMKHVIKDSLRLRPLHFHDTKVGLHKVKNHLHSRSICSVYIPRRPSSPYLFNLGALAGSRQNKHCSLRISSLSMLVALVLPPGPG